MDQLSKTSISIFDTLNTFQTEEIIIFMARVESLYPKSNKFHNFDHAVDVLQFTHKLSTYLKLQKSTRKLLYVAAILHDIDHPGTLQHHHKHLETHHANMAANIIKESLPSITTSEIEEIKSFILDTDIQRLPEFLLLEQKSLASLVIKCSDLNNYVQPLSIHLDCTNRLYEEMMNYVNEPQHQIPFIDSRIRPLFLELAKVTNNNIFSITNLENNYKYWLSKLIERKAASKLERPSKKF